MSYKEMLQFRLNQIVYFLSIVDQGSFSRAAAELGLAQPTLTRAVQNLEDELGGRLFNRRKTESRLTNLGRTVLPHLKSALLAVQMAKSSAAHHARMDTKCFSLIVSHEVAIETYLATILSAVAGLEKADLQIDVASNRDAEAAVAERRCDLALLVSDGSRTDAVDHWLIARSRMVLIVPPEHRFVSRDAVTANDLAGEVLLISSDVSSTAALRSLSVESLVVVGIHGNDGRVASEWVKAGFGCALLLEEAAIKTGLPYCEVSGMDAVVHIVVATSGSRRREKHVRSLLGRLGLSQHPDVGTRVTL